MTIQNPAAGRYYLRTSDHGILQGSQIRDYSVRVQIAQPLITVNNDFVRIEIDPNRACITSLVFKKGSSAELIEKQWGHYLLDLGADATRGSRLSSGWEVESDERDASYVKLSLKHPSGFANKMAVSWTADRVDVACDMTVPETVSTYPSFRPGGGWEASRDKWAFPTSSGVQTGSFSYPGGTTRAIFPADGSFKIPSEGWIALWDDQVDEVYGFTFSDGYAAAIWNGAAADPFLRFPIGASRVGFHIVKGKPANPYEAIRSIVKRPALSLTKKVNALFAIGGAELSYTLTFSNTGQSNATNVVLEVTLPAGVELVPGSISGGGTYDAATRKITWMLSSMAFGAQAQSVTFKAKIKDGLFDGTLVNVPARLWCAEQPAATETTFVTTIGTPVITGISPNKGGNSGTATVNITGRNLDPRAEVKLRKTGQNDIVGAWVAGSSDGTRITRSFNLTSREPGTWDLFVSNPTGGAVSYQNGFTLETAGEAKLSVEITGRDTVRPGRPASYIITVENTGNTDALSRVLWIMLPLGTAYRIDAEVLAPPTVAGWESVDWSLVPYHFEGDDGIYIPMTMPVLPASESISIPIQIVPNLAAESFSLSAWIRPSPLDEGLPSSELIRSPMGNAVICQLGMNEIDCYSAIAVAALDILLKEGIIKRFPGRDCLQAALLLAKDKLKMIWGYGWMAAGGGGSLRPILVPFVHYNAGFLQLILACASDAIPQAAIAKAVIAWGRAALTIWNLYQSCKKAIADSVKQIRLVSSLDPNDKSGPNGFDAIGTSKEQYKRYIASNRAISYVVRFENLETATAAAQDLSIADQMDGNLDRATFSFDKIQVGKQTLTLAPGSRSFSKDIDLRPELPAIVQVSGTFNPATGVVQWYLKGVDPYTGFLADFLPPNTDSVAPRGEGWVSYSVKPKANLPTGTIIKNKATIDFEVGVPPAPMDTPEVFNTIDSTRPASQVLPLNGTGCASFEVKWSGTDEGSGIRNYTIYVSDNGAAYQPWLSNTAETHATYAGAAGHAYAFYSVAQDNVGNTEEAPAKADATNTVTGSLTLSAESQTFPSTGGTGSFDVMTGSGCPWTATSNAAWITITSGSSGSGNGKVAYMVAASSGSARTGTISVAGKTFTVKQQSGLVGREDLIGSWAGQGVYWRNSDTGEWAYLGSYATRVSAGDLDGDGVDDILGAWAGSGLWVRYSSTGQWILLATPPDWIAVGDLNADGKVDLLGIWSGTIWVRDGATGQWAALSYGADKIDAGDLDGDGRADLIGNWPGNGVWVKHSTTGQWELLASPAEWIAVGDLNGNGRLDLLGIWGGTIWSRDTATGQWTALSYGADKIAAGDLDADGKADLIGNWPDSGVWVKYTTTLKWERLASAADYISTGRLR